MKEKTTQTETGKITGFFDKNTEIEGTLKFSGSFQIDGRFKGTIDSKAILVIGENGKVESDIKIGVIVVNGEVKGNIRASERVEINPKGKIIGTIITPSLIVQDGANLDAQCNTTERVAPQKPKPQEKPVEKDEFDIQEKFLS